MAAGGFFVLLAGILLISGNAPQASFPAWFLSVAGEVSIAKSIGILAAVLILWWLKDHFTYPRTGFVRGKRISAAQVWNMIGNVFLFLLLPILGLLAVSLLIASAGRVLTSMPAWFPIGLGILWAVLCVAAGEWMGLRRFRLLGVLILLTGLAVGFWQFSMGVPAFPANAQTGLLQPPAPESITRTLTSLSLLTLFTGGMLIFSGIATFLRYRKENPTPYTEGV
jgi:hypothetical protein